MKKLAAILSAAAMLATAGAQAQWVINEIVINTDGTPDPQYIELYNPVAGSALPALSIVCIRASQNRLHSKIDVSPVASVSGNYYLIANAEYNTLYSSVAVADFTAPNDIRTSFCTVLLVPTSSLNGGWTYSNTTGTVLAGTEFNSGADILDRITFWDNTGAPTNFFSSPYVFDPADAVNSPSGAQRLPNGSSTWVFMDFGPNPGARELPVERSPKAANVAVPSSVAEWSMYH